MLPRPALLLTVLLVLVLPLSAIASSSSPVVGPGQTYTTIQAAVDHCAATKDCRTIYILPGVYNESVVIRGMQNLTIGGSNAKSVMVIGSSSHAIQITSADGLVTPRPPDDVQTRPVGKGAPNADCVTAGPDNTLDTASASGDDVIDAPNNKITSGPNGICETTATGDDDQTLPVGQGYPNSSCVGAGPDATLQTTASGDDVTVPATIIDGTIISPPAINSGPDGVCDTTAVANDDVLQFDLNVITSGPDGICNTTAAPGDTQTVPVGQGDPNTDCVTAGPNNTLDTASASGDVVDAPNEKITSGLNGICETTATGDDVQALPVGKGKPNGGCVTAGMSLKRSRNLKVANLSLRAPDGFDGVHVDRSDFVTLKGLRIDGKLLAGDVQETPVGQAPAAGVCVSAGMDGILDTTTTSGDDVIDPVLKQITPGPDGLCDTTASSGDSSTGTGANGIFIDATAVKPLVKSCSAKQLPPSGFFEVIPHAGFFIEGPGAVVTGCTAESNEVGFDQGNTSDSALYTGNTAAGNGTGFLIAGQANIIQRCVASSNLVIGFDVRGVGNILYQVVADGNGTGIQSVGRGTRIRSSAIQNSTGAGVQLIGDAQGSEIFASFIRNNATAGVEDNAVAVVIHSSKIGPIGGTQNVGVHLMSNSRGTLLEKNRITGNKDASGNVCDTNAPCDLKDDGQHNAGRSNRFSPGFTAPQFQ